MAPGISHSRFTHPIDSERPKGASRFDFWVKIGRREVCWIVTPTPQPARAGGLSADDDIGVRYVHVQDLAAHGVWIENWLRILPYLASNERFVSERLLLD